MKGLTRLHLLALLGATLFFDAAMPFPVQEVSGAAMLSGFLGPDEKVNPTKTSSSAFASATGADEDPQPLEPAFTEQVEDAVQVSDKTATKLNWSPPSWWKKKNPPPPPAPAPAPAGSTRLPPNHSSLRYVGRHHVDSSSARFDWVGTGVEFQMTMGGRVMVDLSGNGERFAVWVNGKETKDFFADGRREQHIGTFRRGDRVFLQKTGESKLVTLHSLSLLDGAAVTKPPRKPKRIDVYGDSDTTGFGADNGGVIFACAGKKTDNFAKSWANIVANDLDADYHVQAQAGIAVNAGFTTLPDLIPRTLFTVKNDDFQAQSWESGANPDAILIYVGANDWVINPFTSGSAFEKKYRAMVHNILKPYPSITPSRVVHICQGMPGSSCPYTERVARENGHTYTKTPDMIPKGCTSHRSASQQVELAKALLPVIRAAANGAPVPAALATGAPKCWWCW